MIKKVEIYNEYVIKYNTSKFSKGIQKITEFLGINFSKELRVYRKFHRDNFNYLLIPKMLECNKKYIVIEKIENDSKQEINPLGIIPNLLEFMSLGLNERINLFDLLSSPAISIYRGVITGVINFGFKTTFKIIFYTFIIGVSAKCDREIYLIHKDLHRRQNIINSKKGIYFIDFGSSFLTKKYFLTDIVQLSIDLNRFDFRFDFDIAPSIVMLKKLGYSRKDMIKVKYQIHILLFRRFLHLHSLNRSDKAFMEKARVFISKLEYWTAPLDNYTEAST